MPIDPDSLPQDAKTLQKIVLDLIAQLDRAFAEQHKYEALLRELLDAQRNRKSERLSKEQLALFEAAWQARPVEDKSGDNDDDLDDAPGGQKANETQPKKRGGRQPLARNVVRERIVHDLAEAEKHCQGCGQDMRLIAEETSERYEFVPASLRVIQDVRRKYACECTVKTAAKPPQPIEKSTAGASLLAHVIVSKFADHQPLHRQEKMFERHGNCRLLVTDAFGRMSAMHVIRWWSTITRRHEREQGQQNSSKGTPDICRRTPTPSTMHFSNPSAG